MEAVGDNPRSSSEAVAPRNRKGFSLVEAAIVLGVVGLVIGGIWVAAATVIENHKVNKTVEGITTNVSNIRKFLGRFGVNPNCAAMCAVNFQAENYRNSGVFKGMSGFYESYADDGAGNMYPVLNAPVGTDYIVLAHSYAPPLTIPGGEKISDMIIISVRGLNKSACIKIAKKLCSRTNKDFGAFEIDYIGGRFFLNMPMPPIHCASGNINWVTVSYKL